MLDFNSLAIWTICDVIIHVRKSMNFTNWVLLRVIRKIRFLSLYEPDVDWFLADRNFFTEIVHEWEVRMEAKICKISNHSATSFECRKTSILKQEIRREIVDDSLIGIFWCLIIVLLTTKQWKHLSLWSVPITSKVVINGEKNPKPIPLRRLPAMETTGHSEECWGRTPIGEEDGHRKWYIKRVFFTYAKMVPRSKRTKIPSCGRHMRGLTDSF